MDWVPIVFVIFKVTVLSVCMFFAIKWHYDQDKKKKEEENKRQQEVSAHDAPPSGG